MNYVGFISALPIIMLALHIDHRFGRRLAAAAYGFGVVLSGLSSSTMRAGFVSSRDETRQNVEYF